MIPDQYAWLLQEQGPKMIVEGIKLYGVKEVPGEGDNPEIMSWATECGLTNAYSGDEVPWCGLYVAVVAKRAGKVLPKSPLWALDWKNWGRVVDRPMLGDVAVLTRAGGGHVAIYVGEDKDCYHLLGGNQSDAVNIMRFPRSRKPAFRRPAYINTPIQVRVVNLAPTGAISVKEV